MDSRPQTLVYKLVIAASKKVVRTTRFDAAMSLGASSDWCRFGRLFLFIQQMLYQSQVASPSNGRGGMFVEDECVAAVVGGGCLVGRAGLKPAPTGWLDADGMIVVGEGVAAVRGAWLFGW